jgi:hypothetical protein
MRSNNAPPMDAAKREQKEFRLRQFIEAFIDADAEQPGSDNGKRACLLIARSPDSPVARVIADLVRRQRLKLPVRAIFAAFDSPGTSGAATCAEAVRIARDPRLLDAHEQLVLGPRTSWVGDCMRRDPLKLDAYEAFAADGRGKARRAAASFERLWQVSVPVNIDHPLAGSGKADTEAACVAAIADEGALRRASARAATSR